MTEGLCPKRGSLGAEAKTEILVQAIYLGALSGEGKGGCKIKQEKCKLVGFGGDSLPLAH